MKKKNYTDIRLISDHLPPKRLESIQNCWGGGVGGGGVPCSRLFWSCWGWCWRWPQRTWGSCWFASCCRPPAARESERLSFACTTETHRTSPADGRVWNQFNDCVSMQHTCAMYTYVYMYLTLCCTIYSYMYVHVGGDCAASALCTRCNVIWRHDVTVHDVITHLSVGVAIKLAEGLFEREVGAKQQLKVISADRSLQTK